MVPKPELSVSLAGLSHMADAPWAEGPRAAIEWAASAGFRAVQLDATTAGIRARELSRSARRDLAALLRRRELQLSGLDLWIPPEHFEDPQRMMRALDAVREAMGLAAELAQLLVSMPVVCVSLPATGPQAIFTELEAAGAASGCILADHCVARAVGAPEAFPEEQTIRIGIDPAALLAAGHDPGVIASKAGKAVASARLAAGLVSGRADLRGARLDEDAYLAGLNVAGYSRPLVLDLRGAAEQDRAARDVLARW